MKYYAGLDVAMKVTFLCILKEDGEKIYERSCLSNPQDIYHSKVTPLVKTIKW
tara:strand:- start:132 stop:290 length:159 start_codon:yes stop_codon:yes gene_type:complete